MVVAADPPCRARCCLVVVDEPGNHDVHDDHGQHRRDGARDDADAGLSSR